MAELTKEAGVVVAAEKSVLIFHTGKGHGPLQTAAGTLFPGQSLAVPEGLAEKLTRAYKHVRLAKDVIPGGGMADPAVAAERDALKVQVAALEAHLAELNDQGPKAIAAAQAEAKEFADKAIAAASDEAAQAKAELEAKVADLTARLGEFLAAKDKKGLEALQEKHAVLVGA